MNDMAEAEKRYAKIVRHQGDPDFPVRRPNDKVACKDSPSKDDKRGQSAAGVLWRRQRYGAALSVGNIGETVRCGRGRLVVGAPCLYFLMDTIVRTVRIRHK